MEALTDVPFLLNTNALLKSARLEPGSDEAKEFAAFVDAAREVARPKALYKESYIDAKGDGTVVIDGVAFTSRALRKNLDAVERVFPYVVTCGNEADTVPMPHDDYLKGFWLDGIKAALLGAARKHLHSLLEHKYRLGKTAVMNPGAGDADVWPIEQQVQLFSLFGSVEELIGVRLTDSFLMVPNKSVSGIRFASEVDFESCRLCHRENCPGRRAAFDKALWDSVQESP
ncbi:MAG: vitamin B12 dependent methionine synthase [Kiritimatiellae bacterium]|nr:vitamin B12 dependent methionine synthase [Kiritimatiellia bacterium]